jgi:hypothetical protein
MATFPFLRDINPKLDDIPELLRIIAQHEGDNDTIAEAIETLFGKHKRRTGYSIHSIKANTMSSLREANLGLMTPDGHLTQFAKRLRIIKDLNAFKAAVARHLIVEKGGLAFCRAVQILSKSGTVHRQQISDFLAEKHSVDFWRDLNNISSMHNFLEWAGVCTNYRLNEARFKEVVGIEPDTARDVEELSPEANMLLQALVRAGGRAAPGELREQAELLSGRRINPHTMPFYGKELERADFIELPGQRGSKTAAWKLRAGQHPTILADVAASLSETRPLPDEVFSHTFGALLKLTRTASTDKKGRALEYLAGRICWKLGLQNIEIRKLSDFEIDVRAESRRPVFQKWVMQCKATRSSLGPAPVLRDYGIAKLENIPVIVFVVTSSISGRARSVSDQIMRQSNKVVIILDEAALDEIAADENAIYKILERQSNHARDIKLAQKDAEVVGELVGETEEQSLESERAPGRRRRVGRRVAK